MNSHKFFRITIIVLIIFAIAALIGGWYIYRNIEIMQQPDVSLTAQTDKKIMDAYTTIDTKLQYTPGDLALTDALKTLRAIAADEHNSALERARALNGINYAYTQSNFDADSIRQIVFSSPPFDQYYVAPSASTADVLHPESGPDVAAVETAMVKLNELSNSLTPNHYALTRLEAANIFAYQRAASDATSTQQRKALQESYGEKEKQLVEAYHALPALKTVKDDYSSPMLIQMLLVHSTAVAFVGTTLNDKTYYQQGEADFVNAIQAGGTYATSTPNYGAILDETLLARIFYASTYWNHYKNSDPAKLEDVLRPMITDPRATTTAVYTTFLPSHKDASVLPFTTLREIAAQMPELKTFLQGRGWQF